MKRLAALTAALLLMLMLSVTASAADAPASEKESAAVSIPTLSTEEQTSGTEVKSGLGSSLRDAAENGILDVENQRHDYQPAPEHEEPEAQPTEFNPLQPPETTSATPDSQPTDTDMPGNRTLIIAAIIGGAVVLILIVVVVILLLRKRTPSDGEAPAHSAGIRGLAIEVEVLSGLCYNESLSFHIRRNLTIGTDAGCDLVFEDAAMQPMHAVISRTNDAVTIGECAEFGCTYVGGMKIFSANRLRSGDIVTIGSTSFRITF